MQDIANSLSMAVLVDSDEQIGSRSSDCGGERSDKRVCEEAYLRETMERSEASKTGVRFDTSKLETGPSYSGPTAHAVESELS